jgi:hypothetical protein
MMSNFLTLHHDDLILRCAQKAAQRPLHQGTQGRTESGIPLFIAQLQRTLDAEERHQPSESLKISGAAGGDAMAASEMGTSAARHGKQLLDLGFSVDQVVHGYGDLCQAVTDLAFELDASFAVSEFRTLNRCLDNAIASAVTAFSDQRETSFVAQTKAEASEGVEALLHSLRSSVATASYAATALEHGNLSVSGSTGRVLQHSLDALRRKLGGAAAEDPGA